MFSSRGITVRLRMSCSAFGYSFGYGFGYGFSTLRLRHGRWKYGQELMTPGHTVHWFCLFFRFSVSLPLLAMRYHLIRSPRPLSFLLFLLSIPSYIERLQPTINE
ncbi:hypothetical protein BDV97DRAFT_231378 [Delphinella strobiligena]|nr:hypothetical protein BDV97DRAFT_231378 [Delphinella strobiligena]